MATSSLQVFSHPWDGTFKIYLGTKFEIPSFTRSKDMAQVRVGVLKLTRGSLSFFILPIKSGVNIVEWSMLYGIIC